MNITDDEIQALENAKTEEQWNAVCDSVKKDRGGQYPPDWAIKVMASGVLNRAIERFEKAGKDERF